MTLNPPDLRTPVFGQWDERRSFADWAAFAASNPDLDRAAVDQSMAFLTRCFDQFNGRAPTVEAGHVFVLPARVSSTTDRWGDDTIDLAPMFEFADAPTRVAMLTRLPPFIVDTYQGSTSAAPGAVVFCPLFPDMLPTLGLRNAVLTGRQIAESTLQFAARTGARLAGLGGTLPSITQYGKAVDSTIPTTSGHGGTLALLRLTVQRAEAEGSLTRLRRAAVIGAGAIGTSAAIDLGNLGAKVQLVDTSSRARALASHRIAEQAPGLSQAITVSAALERPHEVDLIVGAATTPIDLGGLAETALMIDDSQPPCIDPAQIGARQSLRWVVGQDRSEDQVATRIATRYGSEGLSHRSDVWGCEAEAAALAATDSIEARICGPVTPGSTDTVANLFSKVGIVAAEPQAFGRPLGN